MQTATQRTKNRPTGLPYWQPVIGVTNVHAIQAASATTFAGSFANATTFGGAVNNPEVDVVSLVGAGAIGASLANAFRSSLPLDEADLLWTRMAAGARLLYVETPLEPIVEPPVVERSQAVAPRAFQAFKDLGSWLDADDDEVAGAVGIGRTTPYAWRREGHEPRARTVRRLYELHAMLDAVRRQLGSSRFGGWLSTGSPSRRSRLLAGDIASVAPDVDAALFGGLERPDLSWSPEPADNERLTADQTFDARPSGRSRRTARI
jgi:hypothetical protein